MKRETLDSIPRFGVSFDCETHKIQPGLLAPPLVCASVAALGRPETAELLDKDTALHTFIAILDSPDAVLVEHNGPYDNLVMVVHAARQGINLLPKVFAKYMAGKIYDTGVAEMLHAVAGGHLGIDPRSGQPMRDPETNKQAGYRLSVLLDMVCGRSNAKANDRFRTSYALLDGIPMSEWPVDARTYPLDDTINTGDIALAQLPRNRNMHDLSLQVFADWCLHLADAHGFLVDPAAVSSLESSWHTNRDQNLQRFIDLDFFKMKDGRPLVSAKTGAESKNMTTIKGLIAEAYGVYGVCDLCGGSGRVQGLTKHKACSGAGCTGCQAGKVENPKTTRGCKRCDTTGRDLNTAPVPRTDKGAVSTGRDALTESGHELLIDFAAFSEADKIGTTYIPWLKQGISEDGKQIPLTLRHNVLLATGRVSYSGVVQLLPRKGGVRECIVPRPGHVFCSSDYSGVELVTHAQSCLDILGWSKLAEALNSGIKVHDKLGAEMSGITYEEFLARHKAGDKQVIDYRQAAKPGNFMFPGGGGAPTFVLTQRKADFDTTAPDGTVYKGLRFCLLIGGAEQCGTEKVTEWGRSTLPPTCKRCIECAESLREAWFTAWPENRHYFKHISELVDNVGELTQHYSKRVRGGIEFCSAANSYFQGLAADAMKRALCRVAYEEYVDSSSALYGCRTILFAHDELIVEMPEQQAHAAAQRLKFVMESTLKELCPDMVAAVEAEPCLMRRWYKGAEPVYKDGILVPWEPLGDS